jgi:phage host-nuclease inhibitor protein Gam
MSETSSGFGSGILKGLKRILFTEEASAAPQNTAPAAAPAPAANPQPAPAAAAAPPVTNWHVPDDANKEMKLKIYQLLESMNRPGVDFFEVWNAATEMGGATPSNIKAAFTSLKFADKTLSKAKLLETAEFYKTNLQKTIDVESQKRLDEKNALNKEMEQMANSLSAEIKSIEQQIQTLQEKLSTKQNDRATINEKYEPKIAAIDSRINTGRQSVNEIIGEMQQVIDTIQKEIN